MSSHHPVQLHIERSMSTKRIHVVTRLLLLIAVGALGCSSLYWALYFAIPAVAALMIQQRGGEGYLATDGPRIVRVLRWFAAAYGYLWLLTDVLPTAQGGPVDLQIAPSGRPTLGSAVVRIVTSLPALLLLAVLSAVAGIMWVIGALWILITERMPSAVGDFLALTLRVEFRLIAYHLSLVDRYPSLEDAPAEHAPVHA